MWKTCWQRWKGALHVKACSSAWVGRSVLPALRQHPMSPARAEAGGSQSLYDELFPHGQTPAAPPASAPGPDPVSTRRPLRLLGLADRSMASCSRHPPQRHPPRAC